MAFLGDRGRNKEKRMWIHLEWWVGWKGKKNQYFNNGVLGFNKLLYVKINNVLCYLSLCGAYGSNFGIFAAVTRKCHQRPLEYIQVDRYII